MTLRNLKAFAAMVLLLLLTAVAHGQEGKSRLSGTVTDGTGAAVAGATVTLTSEATGISLKQTTTSDGVYSFASLDPGKYTITVEQTGFKKVVRSGNVVAVNTPLNVDVGLEVGQVAEVVTVQAEAVEVQSNTATLGNVVDQRTIETLPLNGRNPLTLVLNEPGVVQRSFGGLGSGVHINGSRDRAYNVTIDGIDANESTVPNPVSNLYRITPDNVQEFKVTTNNATAEEGRNSGASISLSTRSGGNEFHGTLFYFLRNDALNSAEFFANALGQPKRVIKLNQFGGEVSGPIIKKKTFFFASYQRNYANFTQPIDQTFGIPVVYTALAKSGKFRYFKADPANPLVIGGTTITRNSPLLVDPVTGNYAAGVTDCTTPTQLRCVATFDVATNVPTPKPLNPNVTKYLATLPAPNSFVTGDGLNFGGFLWNPPTQIRGPAYSFRVDHNINNDNSIFGRFLYSDYNTLKGDPLNARPQVFPTTPPLGEVFRKTHNLVVGWKHTFSNYIVNDFRGGYSRFDFLFTQGESNPDFPNISSVDYNTISEPYITNARTQRFITTPQFLDNLSIVKGNHVIGLGFNFRFYSHHDARSLGGPTTSLSASNRSPGIPNPTNMDLVTDKANLDAMYNNLLGIPFTIVQPFAADFKSDTFLPYVSADGKPGLFDIVNKVDQYNVYAQDEWKFRSNLTINYGMRWEQNPPANSGKDSTFVTSAPIQNGPTPLVHAKSWYQQTKWGYFGPSLGIGWSPDFKSGFLHGAFGGLGQSAIRLGYRIAYDPISSFQVTAAAGSVPGLTIRCTETMATQSMSPSVGGCPTVSDGTVGNGLANALAPPTAKPSSFLNPSPVVNSSAAGIVVFAPVMKLPQVHEWSLSWQRELPLKMVMEAAYVGRRGMHLMYVRDINQINAAPILDSYLLMQQNMKNGCLPAGNGNLSGQTCTNPITNIPLIAPGTGITATTVNSSAAQGEISPNSNNAGAFALRVENNTLNFHLRANQQYAVITYLDNSGDSMYHAFQFTLRRRFDAGLGLSVAYTFGKSMDNESTDPVGASSGGGLSTTTSRAPVDAFNLRDEWARSDFDRSHTLSAVAVYELPFGKGRWLYSSGPGWLNQIIGGWSINAISTFMTGEPFSVRSGFRTSNGSHETRAVVTDPNLKSQLFDDPKIAGPVVFQNGKAGFALPAPGQNGAGRNIFVAPSYYNLDMSVVKQFVITERVKLDFRAEAFNVLNRANFDNPRDASTGSPSIQSTLFGQTCCQAVATPQTQTIIQTGESSRVIQFALKLKF